MQVVTRHLFIAYNIVLRTRWTSQFLVFSDTSPSETYALSLHDALPISALPRLRAVASRMMPVRKQLPPKLKDRKSTRLNSSHANNSYAVFCLKKKKLAETCQR